MADWKDAYAVRAAVVSRGLRKQSELDAELDAKDIAMANFRRQLSSAKSAAPIKKDEIKFTAPTGETSGGEEEGFFEKPVVKGFLDAISVGNYATANFFDQAAEAGEKTGNGDILGGLGQLIASPVVGIAKGISGAAGNSEDALTYGELMNEHLGEVDEDDTAGKIIRGVGGFVGDVALDPLTYATFGTAPFIKGAVKGATMGSGKTKKAIDEAVNRARSEGLSEEQIDTAIRNNPEFKTYDNSLQGFLKGGAEGYKDWRSVYRPRKIEQADIKRSRRRGEDKNAPAISATSLGDNIEDRFNRERAFSFSVDSAGNTVAREPIVPKSTTRVPVKERKPVEEVVEEVAEKPVYVDEISDTEIPITKEATENLLDVVEETPVTRPIPVELSPAQKIVEALQKVNFTAPKYNTAQISKLKKEFEARPATVPQKVERPKAPEPESTGLKIGNYELDEAKFLEKLQKKGTRSANVRPVVQMKGGKSRPAELILRDFNAADAATKQTIIDAISPAYFTGMKKSAGKAKVDRDALDDILDDGFDYVEAPNPNALTPEEVIGKGFDAEDIADFSPALTDNLSKIVSSVEKKTTVKEVNKMKAFIKSDRITDEELEILREVTGKTTKKEVAEEFPKVIAAWKTEINALLNPKAPPKKVAEKAAVEADIEKVAEQLATSPQAYDAVAGKERLINNYAEEIAKARNIETYGTEIVDGSDRVFDEVIKFQTAPAKYKTRRGYNTPTPTAADGGAWKPDRWNSMHNITLHNAAVQEMVRILPKGATSNLKAKTYLSLIKLTDAKLRASGVQPYMSWVGEIKGKRLPKKALDGQNLSLSDVMHELGTGRVSNFFFYKGKKAPNAADQFAVMGAVETLLRGRIAGTPDDVLKKEISSWITQTYKKPGAGVNYAETQRKALLERLGEDVPEALQKTRDIKANADKFADSIVSDSSLYHRLSVRKLINSTQHATEVGARISDVTSDVVRQLNETTNANDFIKTMKDNLGNLSKTFSDDELELARKTMESKIAGIISVGERAAIEATERIAKKNEVPKAELDKSLAKADEIGRDGKPAHTKNGKKKPSGKGMPSATSKEHQKVSKQAEADVENSLKNDGISVEEFEKIGATIATDLVRKIHPVQKFFNPRLGISSEGVYRAMNSGLHTVARMQNEFHDSLLRHIGRWGNETLNADFKFLQKVVAEGGTGRIPFQTESQRELNDVISMMFDVSGKNIFARNNIGAEHFNQLADVARLNPAWRFDPEQGSLHNSLLWRKWEGVDNVPDFLSRMHSVVIRASQDIAIAADFSRRFGSIQPKPGYVKIVDKNRASVDSGMYELIDRDLYYPKEVATEFAAVDKLMKESRSINTNNAFGKFIVNVFDPITNAIKASQTTVRPGHWVLSILGDTLRNQLLGVNSIKPYRQALAVMKAGGREFKELDPIQRYRRSQEMTDIPVHGDGDGVSIHVGGSFKKISYESLYKILEPVVMLPPHRSGGVMEDLLIDESTSRFGKAITKATDSVVANEKFSLNELAAKRDNFSRLTIAIDFMSKRKWKSVDEMKSAVEDRVTQWAPTSTDFTAAEAKYGRRSLLYYTWLRGITPRIIETALMKPGVTNVLPKATYNLALANGMDPQSIGNPFPEEGLYPEYYMKNVLGPQWKNEYGEWGINPSSPVIEVANTLSGINGNPVESAQKAGQALLGMATPFVRMPLELAQGAQTNGIPIEDNSQYIGDNLGGSYLSTLSRATGNTINENGIVRRTDSAAKVNPEEQAEHAKLQLFNFLTGLKLTDYQSDSAVRSAAYSMQEKARQEGQDLVRNPWQ